MKIRCCNCFEEFEDLDGLCPYCGYSLGDPGRELDYLTPGTILADRYCIGEVVGAGGFGLTYKAWDRVLDTVVAIKECFPRNAVTRAPGEKRVAVYSGRRKAEYERELKDFLQEARIMSLFSENDNVCNTYSFFRENGTAYIVMEFLRGCTLKDYIKQRGGERLSQGEILDIISQVLAGLEEIHKKNVIHRDIAPDNIWMLPDGTVKIFDFGAACLVRETREEYKVVLKPGFAPPEQYLRNGKIGPWTDIYAAGATLYFLLTGRIPLEGSDRDKEDTLEEPAALVMVPSTVNNVVMRAMAVRHELRYRSARAFMEALKKEKVRTLKAEIRARRRRRRSFVAAVFLALSGAVCGGILWSRKQSTLSPDTIVVWLADEGNTEEREKREESWQQGIALFREKFPQVAVKLEWRTPEQLEQEFLAAKKKERPDLIETTWDSGALQEELLSLEGILERKRESLIPETADYIAKYGSKGFPLGMFVTVAYAQKDGLAKELCPAGLEEFLTSGEGFCPADSRAYRNVQEKLAGRYEIVPAGAGGTAVCTQVVGVYRRSANRCRAAEMLLEYLLTDAVQDILHIRHFDGCLPVSREAWETWLEVYTELAYLEEECALYQVLSMPDFLMGQEQKGPNGKQ